MRWVLAAFILSMTWASVGAGGVDFSDPDDARATVYVVRPGFGHTEDDTWWFIDDQFIGVSAARGHAVAYVPEGTHLFWSWMQLTAIRTPRASTPSVLESGQPTQLSVVEMHFEKGKTYYIEVISKPGVSGVALLDEAAGKDAIELCRHSAPVRGHQVRGEEIARDHLAEARGKAENQKKRALKNAEKEARKHARKNKKGGDNN